MWMTDCVREVKRQLHEVYGIVPSRISHGEPCYDIVPSGIYPMTMDGREELVIVYENRFLFLPVHRPVSEQGAVAPAAVAGKSVGRK